MFKVGDLVRVTANVTGLLHCVGVVKTVDRGLYGVSIFTDQQCPEWYMDASEIELINPEDVDT